MLPKDKKTTYLSAVQVHQEVGGVACTFQDLADHVRSIHLRLTTAITYHDALHGFREGRGTGTATLEAKLLQQLAAMREEVLYVIFLYLNKAYDALDRSRSLEILKGYGVGQRVRRMLREY